MTEEEKKDQPQKPEPQKDELVVSQHSILLDGIEIPYTVTCGTIVLKKETVKTGEKEGESEGEKPKATIFFIAYTRDEVTDPSTRPITFSFNGGPGSSSVWLHLGLLGPRRVEMGDAGAVLPPPYRLITNEMSVLDVTDLVFIDPVSTGYSRPVTGEKAKDFHSIQKDIESVGDFIRLYTSRYQRWMSPKFLIGESYGTTRACGLSGYLQDRHGMFLNGIMLISAVLNFTTLEFELNNELPYLVFLPTYTATAWYHQRLPAELQKKNLRSVLDEVEFFAANEYTLALMKGDALPEEEQKEIAKRIAYFTGLRQDYVERSNLRIGILHFTRELLRSERRTVGRLDSRFLGFERDAIGEQMTEDPSMSAIMGPYTAALNHYVRAELNYESDLPYEILANLWQTWSYAGHENKFVDVGETLRKAMTSNPYLNVYVANGYYDLATPYFATEYTFNHLAMNPSLKSNISMGYFEAGHMMYMHMPSLTQLKIDLAGFIQASKRVN